MTITAYPYLRFSSNKQGKGDSTRRQSDWHEEVAKSEGWRLDYSFRLEDKGRSAFHGDRLKHDLGRFLAAINSGRIKPGSVLLFEEMDRLSRQKLSKAFALFIGILSAGVEIRTRDNHYTEASLDDLGTMVGVIVKQSTANEESRKKSERISANWARWRRQVAEGKKAKPPGKMPGWVRWDGSAFQLVEPAAAAVRLIYKWSAEGLGIDKIVARLNGQGRGKVVPTIGRKNAWRVSYVAKLLSTRSVLGDLTTKDGKVHTGFFPAAVTETEWYRARAALSARKVGRKGVGRTGPAVANLFTGLVHDANDGKLMHQHAYAFGKGKTKLRRALVSAGALRGEPGSTFTMMPYALLEAAFLRFVGELRPGDLTADGRGREEEQLAVLEGRRVELEGNVAKAKARIDSGGGVDAILDLLVKWDNDLKEVNREREELASRLATDEGEALTGVQTILPLLRSASGEELTDLRRRLKARIRELVESIWVLVWEINGAVRAAEIQVFLRGGVVRALMVAWMHGSTYSGLSTGIGNVVGRPGDDAHLADKRLSDYRGKSEVREFFARHHKRLTRAILKTIAAEIEVRMSLAAIDKTLGGNRLAAYLAEETLDGTPPQVRTGRPRRISRAEVAD
jgi:DNA invertase Pin-like site-specific DNA recombinase